MTDYPSRYRIAKCSIERACPKCSTIGDTVVVNRSMHYSIYCRKCGAYIKHASIEDKRHLYVDTVYLHDNVPLKVFTLCAESEKTMLTHSK